MNCGEKISELRKKNGMTQDDLGKAMNVSYQAVSKWERGESQPDFETMSKIAKLFNVSISYFEDNDESADVKEQTSDETPQETTEEAKPKAEDKEETTAKEETAEDTPQVEPKEEVKEKPLPLTIGVCTVCGKMLKEGDEATTSPKLVCKTCAERQKKQEKEAAERQQQEQRRRKEAEVREVVGHGFDVTLVISLVLSLAGYILFTILAFNNLDSDDLLLYGALLFAVPLAIFGITHSIGNAIKEYRDVTDETDYSLVLSLIIGAVFAVVHIGLFLVLYLSAGDGADLYMIGLMIGGAILAFTFVSQFLWGSAIREVFTAGGFTFKLPGFIFTLSIDSILWMIVTKILLGFLAALIFVVTTVVVALVAIVGSLFFFIPCLLWKIGKDRKARKSLEE